MQHDIDRALLTEVQILAGIDRVASEVTAAYRGRDLTVVSVLKGACVFAADLIRRMPIALDLAFISAKSYGNGTEPGSLEVTFAPPVEEVADRDLLVVDDILDSGRTLAALVSHFESQGARSVRTCVFLDKPSRRQVDIVPDFRGFEVEDVFVVGYGLDFAGRYRNLPYVGALKGDVVALRTAPRD